MWYKFLDVSCFGVDISEDIINIFHTVYNGIRIGVPIILIIVGMIGLGKAIAQQKEDEIKKAQSTLIKQAIAAAIVFLMLSLVTLVIGIVSSDDDETMDCVKEILTGKSSCVAKPSKCIVGKFYFDGGVCGGGFTSNGSDECVAEGLDSSNCPPDGTFTEAVTCP